MVYKGSLKDEPASAVLVSFTRRNEVNGQNHQLYIVQRYNSVKTLFFLEIIIDVLIVY